MEINLLRIAVMIASFAIFIAILFWAYSPKRRARLERAGAGILPQGEADQGRAP